MALDELRAAAGLPALALCLAAAFALAWHWLSGVRRLNAALHRAAAEDGPINAPPLPASHLPAIGEIEEGLARLARSLQARAALVVQLRAADEAIVEALPDPLLVLAADRSLLRANRAARRVFGVGANLARGDLAALLRHPVMAAAIDRALAEGGAQPAELVLPGSLTRELSAQVLAMQPPLADGGRLVIVLTDRTEARAMERMRVDFVANASHELRTPLASVMGFIETLRGPARDDPPAQQRFLGIMAEQSERMRRLIDDLLGLSRVEMNEHRPPEGEAELLTLLRAEAAAMEPLFAARGKRLVLALPEGALMARPADADQLAQVARNLLDNALRHATAEVRLEAGGGAQGGREGGRDGVGFTVRDDGPGIEREHIPRLTERFYRVDKGRGRGSGNTGLGLAIVKHILTRHRGQLTIESEPGAGASFRVWVPGEAR